MSSVQFLIIGHHNNLCEKFEILLFAALIAFLLILFNVAREKRLDAQPLLSSVVREQHKVL